MSKDNREILFRGFHPCEDGGTTIYVEGEAVKGWWVEGLLLKSLDDNGTHFEIQTWHEDSDGVSSRLLDVISSTVCRYTGLTDKNGKRIFEGDRIKFRDGEVSNVVFETRNGHAYFGFTRSKVETWDFSSQFLRLIEVIGTIFDAPEVME